ncbi:uncharacterized protein VP01_975g2 [Puccinia sorghi]|uniref:Uncharacterized protein n=1 Tax=Puccinia sorghi TaxID=27349 RepID=A0A0L6U5V2_9BASI|nr:uncharacterized protein VP01_975g2 [Puccinia sorghi]
MHIRCDTAHVSRLHSQLSQMPANRLLDPPSPVPPPHVACLNHFHHGGSHRRRQLRIPFTHSADLYSCILMLKDEVFQAGLELITTQKWAASLISSLPWMAIINNDTTHMPAKIHLLKTNTLQTKQLLFVSSSFDLSHFPPHQDPCAESHKVANDERHGTTWERCDDSGMFGGACRHDVPLLYANVYKSGEKLYYPISILGRILSDFHSSRIGILYDIGCQLETHVFKVSIHYQSINCS